MIKLLAFIRRLPGTTPDEFHTYWRDVHAPRFAESAELKPYLRRYELNHRLAQDYERERHPGQVAGPQWDGVAVQWFDSLDAYREFEAHPAREEISAIDQGRFRAPEAAFVLTHDPTVIVDKPGGRDRAGLKLICILRRNKALELAPFHEHWLRNHGGLFQTSRRSTVRCWPTTRTTDWISRRRVRRRHRAMVRVDGRMDYVAQRTRAHHRRRARCRVHARWAEHPVHLVGPADCGHRMSERLFTTSWTRSATPPAAQFAAVVAAGDTDQTLAVFDRLERSYRNFVDGFDAFAAAIHEWTVTTHGFDALTQLLRAERTTTSIDAARRGLGEEHMHDVTTAGRWRDSYALVWIGGRRGSP